MGHLCHQRWFSLCDFLRAVHPLPPSRCVSPRVKPYVINHKIHGPKVHGTPVRLRRCHQPRSLDVAQSPTLGGIRVGGLMLKKRERHVLATCKPSLIQKALSMVLAGVQSGGDASPGTCQSIERFSRNGCGRLLLDLRTARELPAGTAPSIRNLTASHLGQVLVVTGDVTAPQILQEAKALCRSHFSPQYLATGLLAVAHMLF